MCLLHIGVQIAIDSLDKNYLGRLGARGSMGLAIVQLGDSSIVLSIDTCHQQSNTV